MPWCDPCPPLPHATAPPQIRHFHAALCHGATLRPSAACHCPAPMHSRAHARRAAAGGRPQVCTLEMNVPFYADQAELTQKLLTSFKCET